MKNKGGFKRKVLIRSHSCKGTGSVLKFYTVTKLNIGNRITYCANIMCDFDGGNAMLSFPFDDEKDAKFRAETEPGFPGWECFVD
jgi:hypothetical protein